MERLSEAQRTRGSRELLGVVLLQEIRSFAPFPVALGANGPSLDSQNRKLHVGSLSRMPEIEQGKKRKNLVILAITTGN